MLKERLWFLLIGTSDDDPWRHAVQNATASLGTLESASEADAFRLIWDQEYDVIIIDAAKVEDVFRLVSSLRTQKPDARIVVATVSPTWTRAREAFRAGATDYIRKSMNGQEILVALRAAMNKTPPPWRR
jgi:DNA-binding NarL/FixJ family response regulator